MSDAFQIELYHSIVDKEGMDGEKNAIKAYRAAREETENANEVAEGDEVSSALIDRVSDLTSNYSADKSFCNSENTDFFF